MTAREMLSYSATPRMGVGVVGKRGYLSLGFERDGDRTILRHWERRAPLIVQRALYCDPYWKELPYVYIVSSGGPNVDGDRYEQHFTLARDAFAHITTGAATKIAQMRHNHSALKQYITLDEGAYMEYLPEPIIPHRGSRFYSHTHISVAPTATLLYAEIYLCGRRWSGERFDYDILSVGVQAERSDGQRLFRDKFIVRPHTLSPSTVGIMGEYEVMANVILLTPKPMADRIYSQCEPRFDETLMAGITTLPRDSGLIYRVMGYDSQSVKHAVREFSSLVRQTVKGYPLAADFPWR